MKRALVCSMALVAALLCALIARHEGPMAAYQSMKPCASAMSDRASIVVQNQANRYISVREGRDLVARYVRDSGDEFVLEPSDALPLSLCAGDFDEDGIPDLACAYTSSQGSFITLHSGNADSIYPNSTGAQSRRAQGTFTDFPFLLPARIFEMSGSADFIGTGDFNADGHKDIVTAQAGGSSLQYFTGDGRGSLTLSEKINLPGTVTALLCGEMNQLDGLAEVIVAVSSSDGAKALLFESEGGALRARPRAIDLPAAATSMATGEIEGDPAIDLAIACGNELLVVDGRYGKVSPTNEWENEQPEITRRSFSFRVKSITVGDFIGDNHSDIALLADDGTISLLTVPKKKKQKSSAVSGWEMKKLAGGSFPQAASIHRSRLTSLPGQSLVVIDRAGGKLHIIDSFKQSKSKPRIDASSMVDIAVEGGPVAALGMRLTPDALDDLVILRKGQVTPAVAPTAPLMTFIVMNTNDAGMGTLREAIGLANMNPGLDTIAFAVGSGPITISPATTLPAITEAVMLDGETQPGFVASPIVEISGTGMPSAISALTITGGNCVVRGLVINDFQSSPGILLLPIGSGGNIIENNYLGTNVAGTMAAGNFAGIEVDTPNNTIGGTAAGAGNLISGNLFIGIGIFEPTATGNQVVGNLIGVEATCSFAVPNGSDGVLIGLGASNNTVGGTTSSAKNNISGNMGSGVFIQDSNSTGNLIQGNEIGICPSGPIGNNEAGVTISDAPNNTVGGTVSGSGNVISGNFTGVRILMGSATGNKVQGNLIGTDSTGTMAVPNMGGINIDSANNNLIGG
ncbi:MAG: hypothetical protein AB1631_22655, partial [Acidobacteriota bacterium]